MRTPRPRRCAVCGAAIVDGAAKVVRRTGFDDKRPEIIEVCDDCFGLIDRSHDGRVIVQRRAVVATTEPLRNVVAELVRSRTSLEYELAELEVAPALPPVDAS